MSKKKEPLTRRQITIKILKYAITVAIGVFMVLTTLNISRFEYAPTNLARYHILHNAFVIPGVVITLIGVLVVLSNEGSFDGIAYSLKYAIKMLNPFARKDDYEKFSDYIERKRSKGKAKGFGFLLIVGLIFFAISLIFLALYYHEGNALIDSVTQ